MQVVLQGNLRKFPLEQVLTLFRDHEHSGTLDIESGGHRARVFLHNGKVIYAESSDSGAGNAGEAVVRTFEWPEGKFTFLDDVVLPDRASKVSLDVESIIAEAQKRAEGGYPDYAMFRVVDSPGAQDKITMEPEEFKLLFRIGGGKTFGDLIAEPGSTRRDMGQKLKTLESAGLIVRSDEGASSSAPRPRPSMEETAPMMTEPEHEAPPSSTDATVVTGLDVKKMMETMPPPPSAPEPPAEPAMPAGAEATVFVSKPKREDLMAAAAAASPSPETSGDSTMFAPPPAPPSDGGDSAMQHERTQAGDTPVPPIAEPEPQPRRSSGGVVFGSLTPDSGDTYPLMDSEYTVGRDDNNSIAVRDGSISGRHARIVRTDNGFAVEDLGSRNGTFVNGEKVSGQPRLLTNGDLVRFGKVIMTYNEAEESSNDATTVVPAPA
jgi:hypothetical protein